MKTRIIRGIGWCILLLLAGCKIEDDTPQVSSDTVDLTLSVASTFSRSPMTGDDLPEAEKIHTLRVIIVDEGGEVEHNTLIYNNATTGVEEVANKTFKVRKNSSKTVYLLANAEQLPGLDLTQTEGLEKRISEYDQVTLEYLQTAESLPMSSSYSFNVQNINKDCGTLYVAYAATKFTFTFENQMGVTMPLGVSGITIHQIASTSYLYPHGVDRWLSDLLNKTIISAYDIPDKATHAPFSLEDFERVVIESGATYTFPPIYLTESKNTNEIDKVQSYAASLKIGIGEDGSADHIRDVQLTDGTTPLNSLFRNTHVNVRIVVKRLEQIEIIIGIYGMIEPWVELEPVHGSIVEKS